ncbi:MAG: glycosyltransferase family 1 protein [Firmicutes bacterium HGW-Firmicutes-4]|nr:MAG: glycosyltransferase family 1 protein [Firmicutes bacterium HGW-Firmicutes-4]
MVRIAVIMGKMHSGGKKNLVMEYYRHIDRSKIQFDFICDKDSNAIPMEEIELLGGSVYQVTPYQNILGNMKDIYAICKKNKYPIIHGYNGTMNIFAMFIGFVSGIPIRINESISMAHISDKKTVFKNILKPFSRLFSTHYMANGETCGRWQFGNRLYELGKVTVFKTVIDTKKSTYNIAERELTRKEFGIEDNIVIGHIGRLTEQKNTLFIIDIFSEILKRESKAKLLIIGDGNLREKMIKKIEEYHLEKQVLYLGRREDIQQFYNAMDCFILPSLYEGLPVVGVEAETCGLPMFFSTEIPQESSPCDDLGCFIGLDQSVEVWADKILNKTVFNMKIRKDRSEDVKKTGFDSAIEGRKLQFFYEKLLTKEMEYIHISEVMKRKELR